MAHPANFMKALEFFSHNSNDIIIITDKNQNITWVNNAFVNLTGYSREEVYGKNPNLLQGPDSDPNVIAMIHDKLHAGKNVQADIINYTKSGKKYYLRFKIQVIKDDNGKITGFIANEINLSDDFHSMNQMKKMIHHLQYEFYNRYVIISDLCHDINNLLNTNMMITDLLSFDNAKINSMIKVLKDHSQEINNKVQRITKINKDINHSYPLCEIFDECLKIFRTPLKFRMIKLNYTRDPNFKINISKYLINIIFFNLISIVVDYNTNCTDVNINCNVGKNNFAINLHMVLSEINNNKVQKLFNGIKNPANQLYICNKILERIDSQIIFEKNTISINFFSV